jgi:hypothetical protein
MESSFKRANAVTICRLQIKALKQIHLLSHALSGNPVSTHRIKPKGTLFRHML